jgi:hypothetical protein
VPHLLRKRLCAALVLGLFVAPSLSGCSLGGPGTAGAQAGVLGELVEQLKREDDEAEGAEWATARRVGQEQSEQEAEEEIEWH